MVSERSAVHVFGVRHLSPSAAWHLRQFLTDIRPSCVLIEGPVDGTGLIDALVDPHCQPPVALLAYTQDVPIDTLSYPFAIYSPEYQALKWAMTHGREARFIDLPSGVFLGLRRIRERGGAEGLPSFVFDSELGSRFYEEFAQAAGEPSFEAYWQRNFERDFGSATLYQAAVHAFGRELRLLYADGDRQSGSVIREAFMRREIDKAIYDGHAADKIVVVVGAYHTPSLLDGACLSEDVFERLPQVFARMSLIPYSYHRISKESEDGALSRAPAFSEALWSAWDKGQLDEFPMHYLSQLARLQREAGTYRSTADVIDAVHLAYALAELHRGTTPSFHDLMDAATTCLAEGHKESIADVLVRLNIGTIMGKVPSSVHQTSLQDDFDLRLGRLKLEKYRHPVARTLGLDLRDGERVRSRTEGGVLDLMRSRFFHQLAVLGVTFARAVPLSKEAPPYVEQWTVQWDTDVEAELVEAVLHGETISLAAAAVLRARLDAKETVACAVEVTLLAAHAGLPEVLRRGLQSVQARATDVLDLIPIADAVAALVEVVQHGDVRRMDVLPLKPLIAELFLQGSLSLGPAAVCHRDGAQKLLQAMSKLERVASEYGEVEIDAWNAALVELSNADKVNPLLSGFACALLLERNLMDESMLTMEVGRRLSPGIEVDFGAGWFEGLVLRNRDVLLNRLALWRELSNYVRTLDDIAFRRALVFLRRALSVFSRDEKRRVVENLATIWTVSGDALSEVIEAPLSEAEDAVVGSPFVGEVER